MNSNGFFSRKEVILSLLLQLAISPLLAHGYDLRVSLVAGRNVVSGISPYRGGQLPSELSIGYDQNVQGLGETPLWAVYLGACYSLSFDNVYLFNLIVKVPIIIANMALAYLFYRRGNQSWRFFLFNPFLLATSTAWGKPDNIATLLALLSILNLRYPFSSGIFLSISAMVKPLAIPIGAVLLGYYARQNRPNILRYLLGLIPVLSFAFFAPFLAFNWPTETVTAGLPNWFQPAGGISPFNITEYIHGTQSLPQYMLWAALLSPAILVLSVTYTLIKPPIGGEGAIQFSVVATVLFLATRTWLSEQNLILIMALFMLAKGRMPSRWLWLTPLIFSITNNGLQQLLYPLYPTLVIVLHDLDKLTFNTRLIVRFVMVIPWLYELFSNTIMVIRNSGLHQLPR